jgi:phosphatidylserine/phosphatidylglycerophosphate/cardiolipin synthase-like enzyme
MRPALPSLTTRGVIAIAIAATACGAPGGGNGGDGDAIDARGGDGGRAGGADARPGPDAGVAISSGVSVIVEPNGKSGAELVTAIAAATRSVYMTMYQINDPAVLGALVARAGAGVDVQVILDGSASNKSWNQPAYDQLQGGGVAVVWSSPAFTYTHEKTVVIDGQTAWVMTMNLNKSSPRYNREYLAIDTDPDDVAEATAVFVADHAHQVIAPSGTLVVANANARAKLVALIDTATTSLDVEAEEFSDISSGGVVDALVRAAQRGVAVRVVLANQTLPAAASQAVAAVKSVGVEVVMTGPTSGNGTAGNPYIHAKAIVVDCAGGHCARGFVGSENITVGSLGYNRELGVIFAEAAPLAAIEAAIATDFAAGKAQ